MTPVELTVVVPTYNERDNVEPLVAALATHLDGLAWEVVFVDDDSPDGTAARVRDLARRLPMVRCVHRVGQARVIHGGDRGVPGEHGAVPWR